MTRRESPTDSPALYKQSSHYPASFGGKIPLRVRMTRGVCSEVPFGPISTAAKDATLECWVNSHGAVAVFTTDGSGLLGVRPGEFEVVEWHPEPGVNYERTQNIEDQGSPVAHIPLH